ncbi:MAG TPA: neutral/alkaline non-lysosomal ceramidase N-terminal domain-containing protein, partial [Myxococcota bacterium]|nr:neutral/alkaline non-lysosomal ceramidase N-terminal domain-containing protein [Myxococcota bacterium]
MRFVFLAAWLLSGCKPEPSTDGDDVVVDAPGELVAGFGRARVPAPLGIGTAGFGAIGVDPSPSPFAELYPATTTIFGHPEIKVMVVSRGPGHEIAFVRLDAVGVFSQLRKAVVNEVSARLGRDMDAAIVIGATHTHSGPGRVLNSGREGSSVFDIIVDRFFPEFYERFVDAVADAVEQAFDDARAARLGTVMGSCSAGHNDRRCEDGEDYQNPAMPIVAVERDGQVDGFVLAYPVHGTVLGIEQLHLSQDVSGAIETTIEDRFDHPVQAIQFNAWGADMSPPDPEVETRPSGERRGDYDRMWRVGSVVADAVDEAMGQMAWTDEPEIRTAIYRAAIDRELIGYDEGTFPYEYGGVYCGSSSGDCEDPHRFDGIDHACVPFSDDFPAPRQTDLTVGRIGPFALVTFPGEPGTRLAEKVLADIEAADPDRGPALFLGYTQDYLGYSLLEDDWWYGGYEASGALWGPRQGEYLASRVLAAWEDFAGIKPIGQQPAALEPFPYTIAEPYQPAAASDPGTIAQQPDAVVAPDGVVRVVVHGGDPWLGAPLAWIEAEDGAPATRPGGIVLDSDDQNFDVHLDVTPPWSEEAAQRTFAWTFELSPRSPLPRGLDLTGGPWRIVVRVPQVGGEPVVVRSEP